MNILVRFGSAEHILSRLHSNHPLQNPRFIHDIRLLTERSSLVNPQKDHLSSTILFCFRQMRQITCNNLILCCIQLSTIISNYDSYRGDRNFSARCYYEIKPNLTVRRI